MTGLLNMTICAFLCISKSPIDMHMDAYHRALHLQCSVTFNYQWHPVVILKLNFIYYF